jgi:serine/threonine protein kinase
VSSRYKFKRGDRISKWVLVHELGSGGNAEVWRARDDSGDDVALKILRQRDASSEPFRRFRAEVDAMRLARGVVGVLQLRDSSIPEKPSREDLAWLATPIATPIREALGEATSVREVVDAVQSIAATLALLAREFRIHHRDIKPENLYCLDKVWTVGDFGLATYPDKEAITAAGRHIGPLYYLAPEVFLPRAVEAGPVDVYAIAKTLWVLATGQTYPLPGHLTPEVEQFRLSSFTTGEGTRTLDLLISRATSPEPTVRPTMTEFADELSAWLAPASNRPSVRLPQATIDKIAPVTNARMRETSERERRQQYVLDRLEQLTEELQPLGQAVHDATGLKPEYGAWSMFTDVPEIKERLTFEDAHYQRHACFFVNLPPGSSDQQEARLVCGLNVGINPEGIVRFAGGSVVLIGQACAFVSTTKVWSAQMESALERRAADEVLAVLTAALPETVGAFGDAL